MEEVGQEQGAGRAIGSSGTKSGVVGVVVSSIGCLGGRGADMRVLRVKCAIYGERGCVLSQIR